MEQNIDEYSGYHEIFHDVCFIRLKLGVDTVIVLIRNSVKVEYNAPMHYTPPTHTTPTLKLVL